MKTNMKAKSSAAKQQALKRKEEEVLSYCRRHHIKLTPLRQQILMLLIRENQPLTAYSVLALLKEHNLKAQVMSVYRVLDFLQSHGLVHRIEHLNAFMPCQKREPHAHVSQWLICTACGKAEERIEPLFAEGVMALSASADFVVNTQTIELRGLCATCHAS